MDLSNARGGGFGPAPLSYQEIAAWARLSGAQPTPWEIGLIKKIDVIWLQHQAEKSEKPT